MTGQKRLRVRNRAVLDAVAGAAAGCVARFVVGPLDVLKIRFQARTCSQLHNVAHVTVLAVTRGQLWQLSVHPAQASASSVGPLQCSPCAGTVVRNVAA